MLSRILIRMLIGLRFVRLLLASASIFGVVTSSVLSTQVAFAQSVPLVDHHQHLRDPIYKTLGDHGSVDASSLIQMLDASGTKFAVVLSTAYGPPPGPLETEYERVVEENDWTALQVRAHSDRLIGICGINPMKDYALTEIERCSRIPELRTGIKMHFGNSDTDLDDPAKLARLQRVIAAADLRRMAIVIHMHPSVSHQRPYGPREAKIFLNDVLPKAKHSVIQIAHLAGPGGFDPQSDEALKIFIAAIRRHDPRMKHVYFDIAGVAGVAEWRQYKQLITERVRQIGIKRILWGSDGAFGGGMTPTQALAAFHELPLTDRESRQILRNVAPYVHK